MTASKTKTVKRKKSATKPVTKRGAVDAKAVVAQRNAYLAKLTPAGRRAVKQLRAAVLEAAPGAQEVFTYGIPGSRFDGHVLAWYAAWKEHASLYPLTAGMRAANEAALQRYQLSRGTVRFPLDEPLPLTLVKRLVKARVAEIRRGAA
jgi:uncharacterized protein YdhG (YjbR/CyaY superfamily)